MALGSWQGLYNAVILDLMRQQRERELMLLMAIATHADAFGFCYPGRARQMDIRHCGKTTQLKDEEWLVKNKLLYVEEVDDLMRRGTRPFYQISPRAIYVREDLQDYCEAVFDGLRHRDLAWEKKLILILSTEKSEVNLNLSSTKESQPESLTRTRTRRKNQTKDPNTEPHTEPADDAKRQKRSNPSTMRNGEDQSEAPETQRREAQPDQRRKAQDRKNEPPGRGSAGDEFEALLLPTVDDDRMIQEIRHVASTTEYQAREAVETYTRESIVVVMREAARRRQRGTLSSPGGWFFTKLKKTGVYIDPPGPDGQSTYQD